MTRKAAVSILFAASILFNYSCKDEGARKVEAPSVENRVLVEPDQEELKGESPKAESVEEIVYIKVVPVKRANASYITKYVVKNTKENIQKLDEIVRGEESLRKRLDYLEKQGLDVLADKKFNKLKERVMRSQFSLTVEELVTSRYFSGIDYKTGVVSGKDLERYKGLK